MPRVTSTRVVDEVSQQAGLASKPCRHYLLNYPEVVESNILEISTYWAARRTITSKHVRVNITLLRKPRLAHQHTDQPRHVFQFSTLFVNIRMLPALFLHLSGMRYSCRRVASRKSTRLKASTVMQLHHHLYHVCPLGFSKAWIL